MKFLGPEIIEHINTPSFKLIQSIDKSMELHAITLAIKFIKEKKLINHEDRPQEWIEILMD